MVKEKDVLKVWIERIEKESKHGDKTQACRNAASTMTTFQTAMKRKSFLELTDSELKILSELIKILDDRKAERAKLQEQYAG